MEMAAVAHGWLQYTFSAEAEHRHHAEQCLRALEAESGFLPALITIANRFPPAPQLFAA